MRSETIDADPFAERLASLTRDDLRVIQAALTQRITAFSESRRACFLNGELRGPDALIANYAVIEQLFGEQIDESQRLLAKLESIETGGGGA
jgi:hypothetical protein